MQKKFLFFKLFCILYVKDKKGNKKRIKKNERMYDFYFLNYSAYYICKDKGEEKTGESLEHP